MLFIARNTPLVHRSSYNYTTKVRIWKDTMIAKHAFLFSEVQQTHLLRFRGNLFLLKRRCLLRLLSGAARDE